MAKRKGGYVQDHRTEPWCKIAVHAVKEQSHLVGVNGLAVYLALDAHSDKHTRRTFVGTNTIAKTLGVGRRTVERALQTLLKHRWIYRESGKSDGEFNTYILRDIPRLKPSDSAPLFENIPGGTSPMTHPPNAAEASSLECGLPQEQRPGYDTSDVPGCDSGDVPGTSNGTFEVRQTGSPNKEDPLTTNTSTKPSRAGADAPRGAQENARSREGPAKPLDAFRPQEPQPDQTEYKMLFRQVVAAIDQQYLAANSGVPPLWNDKGKLAFRRLKQKLLAAPHWKAKEWLACVQNYYASDGKRFNRAAAPYEVIDVLPQFIGGPRTRFGGTSGGSGENRSSAVDQRADKNSTRLRDESAALRQALIDSGKLALPDPSGAPAGGSGGDAGAVRTLLARVSNRGR